MLTSPFHSYLRLLRGLKGNVLFYRPFTRDERDLSAPIVSVSLGAAATFLFGGLRRKDKPRRIKLEHGDVVVWGGPVRRAYHGVAPLWDRAAGVII